MARCIILGVLALSACAPVDANAPIAFDGTPPDGFGRVTTVVLEAAVYPVAGQENLVVETASYDVRRVASDRIRIGFSAPIVVGPDGVETALPAIQAYSTEPSIRVAGTDEKRIAVLAALSFCGLPAPDAQTFYAWGDENLTRAEDTGEWQFTALC